MLEGFLFKIKKNGVNHVGIGIDEVKSLCGSAIYYSKSKEIQRVGETMELDKLLKAHSKICSRCYNIAEKQIESEKAYIDDAHLSNKGKNDFRDFIKSL